MALGLENGSEDNVIAYATSDSDDQYWRIEHDIDGTFTLVNYKYPNKVLDVEYIQSKDTYNVKISQRIVGSNSQKFKIQDR